MIIFDKLWYQNLFILTDTLDWSKPEKKTRGQVLKCWRCNRCLSIPTDKLWCQNLFILTDTLDWSKPEKKTRGQVLECWRCNRCLNIPTDKLWYQSLFILFDTRDWSKPEKLTRTQVLKCCNGCLNIPDRNQDTSFQMLQWMLRYSRSWALMSELLYSFQYSTLCRVIIKAHHGEVD